MKEPYAFHLFFFAFSLPYIIPLVVSEQASKRIWHRYKIHYRIQRNVSKQSVNSQKSQPASASVAVAATEHVPCSVGRLFDDCHSNEDNDACFWNGRFVFVCCWFFVFCKGNSQQTCCGNYVAASCFKGSNNPLRVMWSVLYLCVFFFLFSFSGFCLFVSE